MVVVTGFPLSLSQTKINLFLQVRCFDCTFVKSVNLFLLLGIHFFALQLQIEWDLTDVLVTFLLGTLGTSDVLSTDRPHINCISVEDFVQLLRFGEVFVEQKEKRLDNV